LSGETRVTRSIMRCYIECNGELLCIVVNWCAKQVPSVPAGTLS
jgi:hypothetical protein